MTKRDPLSQIEPLSRRTFLAAAVAGFFPWNDLWRTRDSSTTSQDEDPWKATGNAAERYQRYFVPAVFAPWASDLVRRADLQPNDRVLDVACGTGVVARLAAQRVGAGGTVVGLDLSRDMLAVARALPPISGAAIEWQEGNALSLPFSSHTFQKVLCQQGLQFFSDRAKAVSDMHRVLVPGGRLAVSVWRGLSENPYPAALVGAIEGHLGVDAAAGARQPFSFGGRDELRSLLATAGFQGVTVDDAELEMHVRSVQEVVGGHLSLFASNAALSAKDPGVRRLLIDEVQRLLKPYMKGTELLVPWRAVVGLATT